MRELLLNLKDISSLLFTVSIYIVFLSFLFRKIKPNKFEKIVLYVGCVFGIIANMARFILFFNK